MQMTKSLGEVFWEAFDKASGAKGSTWAMAGPTMQAHVEAGAKAVEAEVLQHQMSAAAAVQAPVPDVPASPPAPDAALPPPPKGKAYCSNPKCRALSATAPLNSSGRCFTCLEAGI